MEFINIELFNREDFLDLVFRFFFNLVFIIILARYLYYRATPRKDYLFTYLMIAIVVFFMCFLLENIKLELGFALGLFAIFGIIRYRTQQIPIREMTYLFLVIGLSVINALSNRKVSYAELVFTNVILVFMTYLLEKVFLLKHESRKTILYENIDLIKPERRLELIKDIEKRTGLTVNRVEIGRLDYLRDMARVVIYYYEPANTVNFADNDIVNDNDDDD